MRSILHNENNTMETLLRKIVNSTGPKWDPWGTPAKNTKRYERYSPLLTRSRNKLVLLLMAFFFAYNIFAYIYTSHTKYLIGQLAYFLTIKSLLAR